MTGKASSRKPSSNFEDILEQERLLHLALKCAHMIAWRHDLSTNRITEIIVGGSTSLGLADGSPITFEELVDIIHPDDRAAFQEVVAHAITSGEPFETKYRTVLPDGDIRWAQAYGQSYGDESGKPLGLIGVVHDITDAVRAASECDESRIRQQRFFRDVLSSVTDGRLLLCDSPADLPKPLAKCSRWIVLSPTEGLQDLRERARSACRALAFSNERRQDFITAVGEASTNAIVHAGGGRGRICSGTSRVQAWIHDAGAGIDVSNLPRATLEKGYTTAGTFGHGMKLLLQTADRVHLLTGSTGTTVVVEQDRVAVRPRWV